MVGTSTIAGGATHGAAVLSHTERSAAQNALSKLIGSHTGPNSSATVFGGVKSSSLSASTLLHGNGSDTFIGGVRSATTHALANIGNDTVVSGSAAAAIHSLGNVHTGHAGSFSLNSDTISVKGATADGVKGEHPQPAAAGAHTLTLSDKTTVTIAGLTKHDIGKLPH